MSSAKETFKELLKTEGQSITAARLTVFEQLLSQEPLSMHELVQGCRGIDRASVYRAVELFEKLGVVQRLHSGWKYKLELTDKFTAHHHHLSCQRCGATTAINEHALETFIESIAAGHAFRPQTHQVEIQGLCRNCQMSGGTSASAAA